MRLFTTLSVAAMLVAGAAQAADKVELVYSDTISENDTRSKRIRRLPWR